MSVCTGHHPISFSVVILMQRIKLEPAQDRSGGPATRGHSRGQLSQL